MKLEFRLEEKDFLDFHLFSFTENKRNLRMLNISKFLLVGILMYYAYDLYKIDRIEFAILLALLAILTLLFYNSIYQSKLKKHFTKIVRDNYMKRIGELETMEFTSDYIITNDKIGEGKTKISEIEKISETQNNFFIKLSNGASFIVPKMRIENLVLLKSKWKDLNIPISENLDWDWKL